MKLTPSGTGLVLPLVALPILLASLACTPKPAARQFASAPPPQARQAIPSVATPAPARPEFRVKDAAATAPELVRVGPELQVPSCDIFEKGGPHLTESGRAIVAKLVARVYRDQ